MLKWLHRQLRATCSSAHVYVQEQVTLQIEEYPKGVFVLYRRKRGDVSLYVRPGTAMRCGNQLHYFRCEACNDAHGFSWEDISYDELKERFIAPSKERLVAALDYMEVRVL